MVTENSWFGWGGEHNTERKIGKRIFEMRGNEAEMQITAKLPQRNKGISLRAFKSLNKNLTLFFFYGPRTQSCSICEIFHFIKFHVRNLWKFSKPLLNAF